MADAGRVARPGLKLLFITGYAESAVLGNGHLEPGIAVLTEPFVMVALANRIRNPLRDQDVRKLRGLSCDAMKARNCRSFSSSPDYSWSFLNDG